ncbi:KAP family NTPase [bacterium]|nr:KAP family NTPase [bacterium]
MNEKIEGLVEIPEHKNIINNLIQYFEYEKQYSPFMITGSWGCGKSTFVKRIAQEVKNQHNEKYDIRIIDSYKYDHTGEALLVLLSYIIDENFSSEDEVVNNIKSISKIIGKGALNVGVSLLSNGLIEPTDIKKAIGNIIDLNEEQYIKKKLNKIKGLQEDIQKIKELITKNYEKSKKKKILVIDELDRCKPQFSMETIEIVKHIFDTEGCFVIFVTNYDYTKKIITSMYGLDSFSDDYLKKFYKYKIQITEYSTQAGKFLKLGTKRLQNLLIQNQKINTSNIFNKQNTYLVKIFNDKSISFREAEQIYIKIDIICKRYSKDLTNWKNTFIAVLASYIDYFYPDKVDAIIQSKLTTEQFLNLIKYNIPEILKDIFGKSLNDEKKLSSKKLKPSDLLILDLLRDYEKTLLYPEETKYEIDSFIDYIRDFPHFDCLINKLIIYLKSIHLS